MSTYDPGDAFRVTSNWSPSRTHPVTGEVQPHRGQDWAAPSGTGIPSAADGVVVYNGNMSGYGNTIVVEHVVNGETIHTLYAHMDRPSNLAVGTAVTEGQQIGTVGNTGVGTGPHLHFEVMTGGAPGAPDLRRGHATVDPATFDFSGATAPTHTPVTAERSATSNSMLERGSRGEDVRELQQQLRDLGYVGTDGKLLPVSGYMGDHTDFALRAFQRDREIEVDGKAGPETRRELMEAINQKVGEARRPSGAEVEPVRTTTGLPWLDEAMSAMGRGDFDEAARITRDKSSMPPTESAAKSAEAPTAAGIVTPEVTTTPLALTIADPKHPQNFLYQQADKALGDQAAHLSPEERHRTVAAIAASAAEGQFRKIDGVIMATSMDGQRNWVATEQVVPRTPPFRAYAEVETARTQPIEASTQAAEKAAQEQIERQQQHVQTQSPSFSGPR